MYQFSADVLYLYQPTGLVENLVDLTDKKNEISKHGKLSCDTGSVKY